MRVVGFLLAGELICLDGCLVLSNMALSNLIHHSPFYISTLCA